MSFSGFNVWGSLNVIAVLLISLLVANMLKKLIKPLRASLIPTSVLGGIMLLIISSIVKLTSDVTLFNTAFFGGNGTTMLEIITYHALAIGFIASALKTSNKKMNKQRSIEIFNSGVTTVSTYLIQAVCGMGITMIACLLVTSLPNYSGVLLPFGYGQGTGQALNFGNIYESQYGFTGGRAFGLTIAALGFLSASIGGVIHLNILKKKGRVVVLKDGEGNDNESFYDENEIPSNGSIDKFTIQIALIVISYILAFLAMFGLSQLLPGMTDTIFGFNFLFGVIFATLIKALLNFLNKKQIIKKKHTNNFLLTRTGNFFFDIMVVSGIAAIDLTVLENYWGVILIVGVVGLVITYFYNLLVAKTLFKEYADEQFLAMFGMLTGTASTGVILLREIDGEFKTPAQDNLVYQTLPAIVFGFPMMLLANLAPKQPYLTFGILIAFFIVMNVILFRSKIFKRKNKPAVVNE